MIENQFRFDDTPERRFCDVDISRLADGQADVISGLAAVFFDGTERTEFELWKGAKERLMPQAFDRALAEDDVVALFNHDKSQILGRKSAGTLALAKDQAGLRYKINIGDNDVARRVADYIRRREVRGSSFTFKVTDQEWIRGKTFDIRLVKGVRLVDVGPATFPAYLATTAEAAGYDRNLASAAQSHAHWIAELNARRMRAAKVLA